MDQTDEQVRLVADDGTLLEHDVYKVDLSDDELRDLYVKLVVVRRIDTESTNLQRQGQLGIWAPCLGQEAAQVGNAIGAKWDGAEQCTAVYFGDGATSEGDTNEAFNFAAVNSAPVVFFCQNNQWAISVPLSKQMAAPIWRRSFGFGFPGVQVDGNDVLAVLAVTRSAADRARDGGGPTLVEAVTYRLGAHTTTDDPTRYRTADDLDMWMAREPIGRYRAFLEKAGLWSDELDRTAKGEADATAARVRAAVEEMPSPPLDDLVDHVYSDPPATLRRQFERLRRFESEFVVEEG